MKNEILSKLSLIEEQLKPQTKPLNFDEAANYLNMSKSYLYKLTHLNEIPHYKPNGKKIYFLQSELNEWLTRNKIQSAEEIEKKAMNRISGMRK